MAKQEYTYSIPLNVNFIRLVNLLHVAVTEKNQTLEIMWETVKDFRLQLIDNEKFKVVDMRESSKV